MRGKSITDPSIVRERHRYPMTPKHRDMLEACLSCTKLRDPDKGFSELDFIDSIEKQRAAGHYLSLKQLNLLERIYNQRVLGQTEGKR